MVDLKLPRLITKWKLPASFWMCPFHLVMKPTFNHSKIVTYRDVSGQITDQNNDNLRDEAQKLAIVGKMMMNDDE